MQKGVTEPLFFASHLCAEWSTYTHYLKQDLIEYDIMAYTMWCSTMS
jgi:glutaredoxin-related protein